MDKKVLKMLIDTVKCKNSYVTRPGLAGVTFTEAKYINDKTYVYACNGYSLIRIECGSSLCFSFNDEMFWPLDEMIKEYKNTKNNQHALPHGAIKKDDQGNYVYNDRLCNHPDYERLINDYLTLSDYAYDATIDMDLLKALAPLGRIKINIKNHRGAKVLIAECDGLLYIQMGIKED